MMTPERRTLLYGYFRNCINDESPYAGSTATAMVDHVAELLAQARADALEEAAKAMDYQARRWSELQHSMLADATEERAYAQGRINAFTEAEGAIRAKKDA